MRRRNVKTSYTREPDLSCRAAYAICRNIYAEHLGAGQEHPGIHTCVCENQGRGQVCDQMNRAALAVVQEIVKVLGEKK